MNFEEALNAELKTISNLKVFPIVAPKDSKPSFVVFRKTNRKFAMTLNGAMLNKVEASYELTFVSDTYGNLQVMGDSIINLLCGFIGRTVGESGPLVMKLEIDANEDKYEPEIDCFRSDITIKVNYQI